MKVLARLLGVLWVLFGLLILTQADFGELRAGTPRAVGYAIGAMLFPPVIIISGIGLAALKRWGWWAVTIEAGLFFIVTIVAALTIPVVFLIAILYLILLALLVLSRPSKWRVSHEQPSGDIG